MITVTEPVGQPTNVALTLVAGGTLPIGTTYYVAVAGFDSAYISPYADRGRYCFQSKLSGASSPVSVTTDATYRSIQVSWTNSAGADRYGIYLSETQDDFTGLKTFETLAEANPNIQSPYTITAPAESTNINHSCLILNNLVHNIDKNLGLIKVSFTGTDGHDLDDVYDAIVAAGFSNYAYYDGFNFSIKGSFIFEGTDAGAFAVTKKSLIFIKGVMAKVNPNYTVRFGNYVDEDEGSSYGYGCYIDFQNSRYPLWAGTDNHLKMYGTLLHSAASVILKVAEPEYYLYYYGGAQQYIAFEIPNYVDTFLGMSGRSLQGVIRDIKIGQNYYGGTASINIWSSQAGLLHTGPSEGFYRSRFANFYSAIGDKHVTYYHYALPSEITYERYWYDCTFLDTIDGKIIAGWSNLKEAEDYADGSAGHINVTLKIKVIDNAGNDVSGADVSIRDQFGNHVTLYTKDYANDDRLLGSTTSPVVTDVNGEIDYYVESYMIEHEDGNPSALAMTFTNYYPFEITISKSGYKDYIGVHDIIEKIDWDVVLVEPMYYQQSIAGTVSAAEISGQVNQSQVKGTVPAGNAISGSVKVVGVSGTVKVVEIN